MKTVGELNLKPGDVVRDEGGRLGVVVNDDYRDYENGRVCVWWHHEPNPHSHYEGEAVAWEVVPKPVPTVASLKLAFGDVVRWKDKNWLVRRRSFVDVVTLVDADDYTFTLTSETPIPEGFVRVQTCCSIAAAGY